jgi:hypothetical protein
MASMYKNVEAAMNSVPTFLPLHALIAAQDKGESGGWSRASACSTSYGRRVFPRSGSELAM